MWFHCLIDGKTVKGNGLQPHISYKHGRAAGKAVKITCEERLDFCENHYRPRRYNYLARARALRLRR